MTAERAVDVAHQQVADEARDVDRHRAAGDAGRLAALDAALGLGQRLGHRVAEVDLLEVARALQRVALGHLGRQRRRAP